MMSKDCPIVQDYMLDLFVGQRGGGQRYVNGTSSNLQVSIAIDDVGKFQYLPGQLKSSYLLVDEAWRLHSSELVPRGCLMDPEADSLGFDLSSFRLS